MRIKDIAQDAIQSGRLEQAMEGQLFELFEQSAVDDTDLEAADQLIHRLLDGQVVRVKPQALDWRASQLRI